MSEIELKKRTPTERAVYCLRRYAQYIDEHAEALVGDIDGPNWCAEGGITVSFTLSDLCVPTVKVEKNMLVLDVYNPSK